MLPKTEKRFKGPVKIIRAIDVDPEKTEIQWLWYPYIPLRQYTTIGAITGIGKSRLALHLVKELYLGNLDLPSGTKALYVDFEGMQGKLIEHSKNWGIQDIFTLYGELEDGHPVEGKRDLTLIAAAAEEIDAKLIIIDTFGHLLGDRDPNSQRDVLPYTQHLKTIARVLDAAIILLVHNGGKGANKIDTLSPYIIKGSSTIVEQCRSAIILEEAKKGGKPTGFILHHVKSNFVELAEPVNYVNNEFAEPIATGVCKSAAVERNLSVFKRLGLELAEAGKSEIEIREAIKQLEGCQVNTPTRVIQWLLDNKKIVLV